jgi:MSHA biogenesis protein MshQ
MKKELLIRFVLTALFIMNHTVNAAPFTAWYFDELGSPAAPYTLNDAIAARDGEARQTPSTGNGSGKICSALDFTASSVQDYAILDASALHAANDFTISVWHKGNSTAGRALLSGARSNKDNALIMWFPNATSFQGYINNGNFSTINFPTIADNQWHHLVWRRAANQTCFFTDGIQRGCHTTTTTTLNIESLILGQEQDNLGGGFSSSQDWEGLLDEMLIYRSALSNTDIQTLYNNQNTGKDWDGSTHACIIIPPPLPPTDYSFSEWRFDEDSWNGSANEVIDSHSNQHGTAHNVSAVPGKICNAMDLSSSSTSDYASLGAESLNGVNDFTISVWHKSTSNNGKSILSGAVNGSDNELIFWFTNATSFNGHLKSSSLGAISTSNYNDNTWHHLLWSRSAGQSCLYLDSQLQGCQAQSNYNILNITSLILGQEQDNVGGGFSSAQDWEGILDELMIFRRALTTSEINSIYNNQNAGKNWDGSYRACPNMPAMKLTKTSQVISDPVNNSNNPKRIPGAIIRYTVRAENVHSTMGENVTITDSLNTFISSGKIEWAGNIILNSPNTNGGAATALSDAIDADVGQFNANTLTVQCGNISNSAPCIVRYDIEIK